MIVGKMLRRAEAGERMRVTVSRRPVAELGPLGRPLWVSGAAAEMVLAGSAADRGLFDELAPLREQRAQLQ
jgi:antitoxin (DNA-binding transcriptional repressor) of toxin-antitoxin stability system